jgi:hypothetical protein
MRMLPLVIVACAGLYGCQTTTVESLPAGASRTCPQEWAGAWIAQDEQRRDQSDGGVYVDKECTATVVMRDAQQKTQTVDMHPNFFDTDGGRYLLLPHTEVAKLLEVHSDPSLPEAKDFVPLRWFRQDRDLALINPDHRRVATWIVQGALNGATSFETDGNCRNVIRGDADAIARVLRDHGGTLFDTEEKAMRFRHVGDDRAALDAAMNKAAREEKRRDAAARRSAK